MNFFEHQASARRQTGRLLVYFLAAVMATVVALNVGIYAVAQLTAGGVEGSPLWHAWSGKVLGGALSVIVGGSLVEYLRLREGGQALARMLGARRIAFGTTEARERQFMNVVAEMSIASGVSAPLLYVMDREPGINAFVAGLSVDSTVMVVTAGALEAFERDELQAVVGHEFSHILNGDMRLNVRLLALLAGILALGQLGSFLMRISTDSESRRGSDRRGGVLPVFLVGMVLWAVGSVGLFFSRLIKAAISRQREFLADASSVQFTRNPDGLAGALIKIRQHSGTSWLANLRAESMSHMCFAEALTFSSWFATHPSLDERIAALGRHYLALERVRRRERERRALTAAEVAPGEAPALERVELGPVAYVPGAMGHAVPLAGEAVVAMGATALLSRAGTVNPRDLASAQELHRRLPPAVRQALESTGGAQALLYALVARQSSAPAPALQAFLLEHEPALRERVNELCRVMEGLDLAFALPLLELAMPRLHLLAHADQRELLARLQRLAQLDRRLTTFEFALLMLLRKQLQAAPRLRPVTLERCQGGVAVVVAALLRTGGHAGDDLERHYQRIMRTAFSPVPSLPTPELTRLGQLARSLQVLGGLSLRDRRHLLELAATAVLADTEVRLEEYELMRVVAGLLDCPMPILHA